MRWLLKIRRIQKTRTMKEGEDILGGGYLQKLSCREWEDLSLNWSLRRVKVPDQMRGILLASPSFLRRELQLLILFCHLLIMCDLEPVMYTQPWFPHSSSEVNTCATYLTNDPIAPYAFAKSQNGCLSGQQETPQAPGFLMHKVPHHALFTEFICKVLCWTQET